MNAAWIAIGTVVCCTAGSLAIAPSALAQTDGRCYMVSTSGQKFDLSALCGRGDAVPATKTRDRSSMDSALDGRGMQAPIVRRIGRIPVIAVTFTGKRGTQVYEMMVDTGASGTVITPAMAEDLGIVPVGAVRVQTAGGRTSMPVGYVKAIEVNGAVANNVLVGIQPALHIGLLGHDFFGDLEVTIGRHAIVFRQP